MVKKTKEANEFVKANVKKSTNTIINLIAVKEDKFVYEVIDDLFREKYPEMFREGNEVPA